jgi:hypothetical protein
LPVRYVHVVFTLPHELAPLALANQKTIYTLLFRLSAETLMEFARDPRLLGAEIGFFSVLHTWNQKLEHHPHVHSVVPEGGISPDGSRWVRVTTSFFQSKPWPPPSAASSSTPFAKPLPQANCIFPDS